MKRSVTIQDISCFGKCSLTVALPIMSAMGIETAIIPTAVLSTHTGGFKGFTVRDLTDEIEPISNHWKKEGIAFDSIYTGYLASERQIGLVEKFFEEFGKDTLVFVDPVMADNGKMYAGFSLDFAQKMANLCKKADVVVPNLTEASFILNEEYKEDYSREEVITMLKKLCDLGCKCAIITGVKYKSENGIMHGAMAYEKESGKISEYYREHIDVSFHGTGDCFSSVLCASMTKGDPMEVSLKTAVDYTVECIKRTMDDRRNHWYGVKFEECLYMLTKNEENK